MSIPIFFIRRIKLILHHESICISTKPYSTPREWKRLRMAEENMPASRSDPVIMKLDTPEFKSIFTSELDTLANLFKKYNYEVRVAGGAVRDLLMGLSPKDLDFATDATPDQMKEMFTKEEIRMINHKGEKHGTITARINDKENFEVTTLRIDVLTNGRHAEVQYTKNWKLDANRRDLTINSMFLDLEGRVYDYFYGYDDLQNRRVVFVGEPAIRIQEDYLRILRYFRFHGRICGDPESHDEKTINAIKDHMNGLEIISGERIWSEWNQILTGNHGAELTLKMLECGMAPYIGLPKTLDTVNFKQLYDRAKDNKTRLRPITFVSSMLKDTEQVMNLHGRLKLSAYDRDLALFLVQHKEPKLCEKPLKPYQELVINSKVKSQDIGSFVSELLKCKGDMQLLEDYERWVKNMPKFPINGHMLKSHVSNGKLIGGVISRLKLIWLDDNFKTSIEDLMKHVPSIVNELEKKKE